MSDTFFIEGPAVISFSGGRTSGYMLRRILDVGLQPDVHVLFANTGKEFPETLQFVADVGKYWGVTVTWLERLPGGAYRTTNLSGAFRAGEPFDQLINEKHFLPNPIARFCTSDLKLKPIQRWMEDHGYGLWDNVVGIRADEPRRIAKMRHRGVLIPLVDAGITRVDVLAFWREQRFDLNLEPHESNCDLCFLKGFRLRQQIVRDHPETLQWWVNREAAIGARFRNDAPRYARLADQRDLFSPDESLEECYCTD